MEQLPNDMSCIVELAVPLGFFDYMNIPKDLTNDKYSLKDKIIAIEHYLKALDKQLDKDYYNLPFVSRKREEIVTEYKLLSKQRVKIDSDLKILEAEYKSYGYST